MTVDDSVRATREFFGPRAATWDERFPDDGRAFQRALHDLGARRGGRVLDLGCGTGRAFVALRSRAGAAASVVGLDLTPEMLDAARAAACRSSALLVLADARRLPFRAAVFDTVFAAGLLPHLRDPVAGLAECARIVRAGGCLALFHPIARTTLAARHGHGLRDDDPLDPRVLPGLLARAGWQCAFVDDGDDRYLAVARRTAGALEDRQIRP